MTTDSTQPQSELEQAPANGQAQSQGHRRRRRRRKSKSSQQGAAQAQQPQQSQAAQPQPQAPPPPPQPKPPAPRQNQNQGQGRKKKKFFQKGAPAAVREPGNSISGPPQGKRKGKQKGPREFVGPMDHSYRIANGNVADGPPSTIQIGNGHGGAYYEDNYAPAPPVPIREDAPTRIFCFIEDLFFLAKIQETARKLGVKVEFIKGDKESVARLTDLPEEERPKLVVFDLNNLNAKPISLIPKLKTKFKKATSIIGFLNHLQGELKAKAIEAGCDTVMPRSAFSQTLPNLLRRYGMEEEEDHMPQPV
jgi:pyruvate/2-oxoglutarate dehydrogenase complex dihydrolipoamide acyltransferase (E2) component